MIDGVMWRMQAGRLPFQPEDGLEIVASGKLTTYPGRSKYQVVIDAMELAGEGALLALLDKTRLRLEAEGLFDPARKRALPFLPRRIGVVTSPTGSVIRDILHRLADRFPIEVLIWPVRVQGQGAAQEVADAVRGFSALPEGGAVPRPDLVIVARGGGSVEDLWAFNEEVAVRAVAQSTIPIICAVGHETDTSLCDFAADRRAPTPTAAAEMAVPVRAELAAVLADYAHRQRRCAMQPVIRGRERLTAWSERFPPVEAVLQSRAQRLDDLTQRLRRGLMDRSAKARQRLAASQARLSIPLLRQRLLIARQAVAGVRFTSALLERRARQQRQRLEAIARVLRSLDPKAPLARGYALVRNSDGALVTSKAKATRAASLAIEFADGALQAIPAGPGTATKATATARNRKEIRQQDLFG